MTTKRLAEFDAHANQLELRIAELRDEFAAVQRECPRPRSSARSRSSIRFGTTSVSSAWRSCVTSSPPPRAKTVSAAAIQRAVALFDPVWDRLLSGP
jgi:hypothetical protein